MNEQMLFGIEAIPIPTEEQKQKRNEKRNWENAFQRWSDEQGIYGTTDLGACGYGSMCDWCEDNSYGRPCVRALNAMCREKGIVINYSDRDFKAVWYINKALEKGD